MADIDAHLVEAEGFDRVAKDVLAGTLGGIAQVLSGQPFDTTKVRLQSAPEGTYNGTMDVVKRLIKNEGFAGFYKGTLTPLIGVGACVSIQFGVNESMKRYFGGGHLTYQQFYVSGVAAGVANAFLASPIEHIRIRLQTQTAGTTPQFKGPIDCLRQINAGSGIRGVFRGLGPTILREGHGMGMYFLAFEALVNHDMKSNEIKRSDIPGYRLCAYGAAAGYAMWISVYPIDVIKSQMQTDSLLAGQQKFSSAFDCFKKIYAASGPRAFVRGFVPTLLRAAPVNACTFYTFELAIRYLG